MAAAAADATSEGTNLFMDIMLPRPGNAVE
jgi:hypothetical protein